MRVKDTEFYIKPGERVTRMLPFDSSRWHVDLSYSCDNLPIGAEAEKVRSLLGGSDLVTRVLRYFDIPYSVSLMSDFYYTDPALERVTRLDKKGKPYIVYHGSYQPINGACEVLRSLESLGVLPCSREDAIRKTEGEHE
jgi:hypothetical protein